MLRKGAAVVLVALGVAGACGCGKEETPPAAERRAETTKPPTAPAAHASETSKAAGTEAPAKERPAVAVASRPAMDPFLAALPSGDAVQWYAVGARGRSFVAKLTRLPNNGGIGAEVYVTGLNGGVHSFRGQTPAGRGAPVVLVTPANEAAKKSQVVLLVVTPSGENAERLAVSAVLEDRTVTSLGMTDATRAQAMIASILSQPSERERIKTRAAQLKAIDYAEKGFGGPRQPGDDVVLVVQGTAEGASVWGSNPYTGDSDPRRAAVHAGLLKDGEWGIVRAKFGPGRDSYEGSEKNGVKTGSWKQFHLSYELEKVD